jgi:hypothetical protein
MAAVLLCLGVFVSAVAGATNNRGWARGTEAVSSGTWAATIATPSMTFTTNSYQTSTVTNTGTVALSAISYKVTVSTPTSGSPTFKVFICSVAWASSLCSGGAGTQVGSTFSKNSSTTVSSTVVPAVGGTVYLQIEPTGVTSATTVTLSASVASPTQLRAAVKANQ